MAAGYTRGSAPVRSHVRGYDPVVRSIAPCTAVPRRDPARRHRVGGARAGPAPRAASSQAAITPPMAPHTWACQEIPAWGTMLDSSAPPHTTPTMTPVKICSALRSNRPRVNR